MFRTSERGMGGFREKKILQDGTGMDMRSEKIGSWD
jgi:hypothetical protein